MGGPVGSWIIFPSVQRHLASFPASFLLLAPVASWFPLSFSKRWPPEGNSFLEERSKVSGYAVATCKDMCIRVHMCIHVCVYMTHTCAHECVVICLYTCVYYIVYICVCILCLHMCLCVCGCACVCVHVCGCAHSHAETSKHYTSVWAQPSDTFSQDMSSGFQGSHFTFQVPHLLCAFGHISQYLLTSVSSFVNGDNKRICLSTSL